MPFGSPNVMMSEASGEYPAKTEIVDAKKGGQK